MTTTAQLRALFRFVREERRIYAFGLVFVVIGIFTALAYPQAIRLIIDDGVQHRDAHRINQLGLVMLVLLIAETVATCLRDYWFNVGAERVTARVRQAAFDALLRQDISFFDAQDAGALTTRLSASMAGLQRSLGEEFADAMRVGLWAVGGTALLFYTSPALTLLVLLALPPMVIASSVLGGRVKKHASHMQEAYAAAGIAADEAIGGIRTVRAFSQEHTESARYAGRMAAAIRAARQKIRVSALLTALAFMVGEGSALLALWAGGHLIVRGQLTSGALISFILYAFLVARGFRSASSFWSESMRSLGATTWIFGLLARQPQMPIAGGARPARTAGHVTFERVHFSFPTRPDTEALSGIDLTIEPGEVVAFVGRSGAGKSSLLLLLLRFYDPDQGRVLLDGTDLRELDPSWLRGQLGIVLQDPVLFSRTIAENIRYGRGEADDLALRRAASIAHAHEFITRLPAEYDTPIGDRGVQLSGGQRQRLAIARAILRRPPILVLDEATSALDAESESLVQEALRATAHNHYRPTTLIVAHRLSTVVNVDKVAVIDQGRILAAGRHEHLLRTCEFYRQLIETQLVGSEEVRS
jgi:ATP-binding cassette subfamily B protein